MEELGVKTELPEARIEIIVKDFQVSGSSRFQRSEPVVVEGHIYEFQLDLRDVSSRGE